MPEDQVFFGGLAERSAVLSLSSRETFSVPCSPRSTRYRHRVGRQRCRCQVQPLYRDSISGALSSRFLWALIPPLLCSLFSLAPPLFRTVLTPDQILALLELVETNNQYNDDDETYEYWVDVINGLQSLYYVSRSSSL